MLEVLGENGLNDIITVEFILEGENDGENGLQRLDLGFLNVNALTDEAQHL